VYPADISSKLIETQQVCYLYHFRYRYSDSFYI